MGGKGSGRPVTAPCGTHGAYNRHIRNNETPCSACKEFVAAYTRTRYRQNYKPKRRTRKNLSYGDAKAYVNAQKRIAAVCAAIDWLGNKCEQKVLEGNEHHFDWDHIDDRKDVGGKQLSDLVKCATKAQLDAEIAKCQLLCKFCHSDKNLNNAGKNGNHVSNPLRDDDHPRLFDEC